MRLAICGRTRILYRMKYAKVIRREDALMLGSLAATTGLVGGLVLLRLAATGRANYLFLGWNTFLAWLPILFAIGWTWSAERRAPLPATLALAGAWLLFLPNAPYLLTDLQHFDSDGAAPRWYDALLFGANALNGLLLGAAALAVGHRTLDRSLGTARAWAAIAVVCLLCGFGIYLGRFVRLNSWDIVTNPLAVCRAAAVVVWSPFEHRKAWFVTLVAGAVQLLCYLTIRGAASLQRAPAVADVRAAKPQVAWR